jgi:transposase-like protein
MTIVTSLAAVDTRDELAVSCPLCRGALANATEGGNANERGYRCTGCGQSWTAGRLQVVAAYARHVAAE